MASVAGRKPPKEFSHMSIRAGENGGHVITHHFGSYEHPDEIHPYGAGEGRELMRHVYKHMNVNIEAPKTAKGG